jgi:hypothetical protein
VGVEEVESDRVFGVRGIQQHNVVLAPRGNPREHFIYEIAVRIEDTHAAPEGDGLKNEIDEEGALAGPRGSHHSRSPYRRLRRTRWV